MKVPAKFQVIQHVRLKYGCPNKCEAPKLAPLAPQLLPRHQVSPRLIATIVTQKFEDHLPLHRQAKIFSKRFGVKFNSTTLSDWVIKAYNIAIVPLLYLMQSELNKSDYIQADETTLQVLNEKGKKAKSKSYIWVRVSNQNRKPIVLMDYYNSRAMKNANELFEGFNKGYLQTDGYKGYNDIANKKDVKQLGCWAHTRRKFTDIVKNSKVDDESKKIASNILLKIKKLYDIERKIKDKPPDIKKELRKKESVPMLIEIREFLDEYALKANSLGGLIKDAFTYINNQWSKLTIYCDDGRLNIDNNIAENHIRPIALGRKNWLFANSIEGAKALCGWYSIIESAKMNGLEPFKYLDFILTEFPKLKADNKEYDKLLPWNVKMDDIEG